MPSEMGKSTENVVSMILMEVNLKKERKNKSNKMVPQGEYWFSFEDHCCP